MEDLSKLKIDRSQKASVTPPHRRARRWPWLVLIVVAAIGGYAATGGKLDIVSLLTPKPKVEVGTVTTAYPSQALTLFNATGYVVPQTKADVASKATGRLPSSTSSSISRPVALEATSALVCGTT